MIVALLRTDFNNADFFKKVLRNIATNNVSTFVVKDNRDPLAKTRGIVVARGLFVVSG